MALTLAIGIGEEDETRKKLRTRTPMMPGSSFMAMISSTRLAARCVIRMTCPRPRVHEQSVSSFCEMKMRDLQYILIENVLFHIFR